jgi:hypothetical protein
VDNVDTKLTFVKEGIECTSIADDKKVIIRINPVDFMKSQNVKKTKNTNSIPVDQIIRKLKKYF